MRLVHELFADRASHDPRAVAVADSRGSKSYTELHSSAGLLAHALRRRGAARGAVIGVCLRRGHRLSEALIAVLRTGAAFLPLDPASPPARLAILLSESGARLAIADRDGAGRLAGAASCEVLDLDSVDLPAPPADLDPGVGPEDLAYLVFTSGSTGRPKLVEVTHRSLASHARAIGDRYRLTPADRVLQFSNPAFDVLAEELFPTLAAGATVVHAPEPTPPPGDLEPFLSERGVTVVNLPSPYWHGWVRDLDDAPRSLPGSLRLLVTGSDVVRTRALARWWAHSRVPVVNAYGLTEATITATTRQFAFGELPDSEALPIGSPIAGVEVHVLDADLVPAAGGHVGELYVGGDALARGYRGHPGLTAGRFVAHPAPEAPGARLLRTGDLARRRADGDIELLGRTDRQVKIRGHRVEPAEVAAALTAHGGVRQAHVTTRADQRTGEQRLVAYVVPAGGRIDIGELRTHIAGLLPAAMVPAAIGILDALPVTPGGKVDEHRLPPPTDTQGSLPASSPSTPMEALVLRIWEEVLGKNVSGIHQTFFDAGGHSILLARVRRRLMAELGRDVSGVALFEHPTVHELARHLEHGVAAEVAGSHRAEELHGGRSLLLERRTRRLGDGGTT